MTTPTVENFADIAPEGPFRYKPDRYAEIVPHFPGFADLSQAERDMVNAVAQGEVESCVVHPQGADVLVESMPWGSFTDEIEQKRMGYVIRRRPVAPPPPAPDAYPPADARPRAGPPSTTKPGPELGSQLRAAQDDLQRIRIERDLLKVKVDGLQHELSKAQADAQRAVTRAAGEADALRSENQKLTASLKLAAEEVERLKAAQPKAAAAAPDKEAMVKFQAMFAAQEQQLRQEAEAAGAKWRGDIAELERRLREDSEKREQESEEKKRLLRKADELKRQVEVADQNLQALQIKNDELSAQLAKHDEVVQFPTRRELAAPSRDGASDSSPLVRTMILWFVTLILLCQCVYLFIRHA